MSLLLGLLALLHSTSGHTPTGTGAGTLQSPVDLGDPTLNSWAITGTMRPNEIFYYSFTITDKAALSASGKNRFYLGYYVPGAGEPGFTFYVAIFGMSNSTNCTQWGGGWGRRRLAGDDDHGHEEDDNTAPTETPHRITSSNTAWLMDSTAVPERVTGSSHDHGDTSFNYHRATETLVFIASPATNRPNKFESFSPTLFKPRGSCIADFSNGGGEYRMAVWGRADQVGTKHWAVGIGLAERDVFAPSNLITFDYILFSLQTWNGWNGFVLILPMLLFCVGSVLFMLVKVKHYSTVSGYPTPFRGVALVCGSMLVGHVIMNIAILDWATSNAHVESSRELTFPLVIGILLPLTTSAGLLLIGLCVNVCGCWLCCGGSSSGSVAAAPAYRCVVFGVGLLHLFLHAGYIIVPVSLLIVSLLPSKLANYGASEEDVARVVSEEISRVQPKELMDETPMMDLA